MNIFRVLVLVFVTSMAAQTHFVNERVEAAVETPADPVAYYVAELDHLADRKARVERNLAALRAQLTFDPFDSQRKALAELRDLETQSRELKRKIAGACGTCMVDQIDWVAFGLTRKIADKQDGLRAAEAAKSPETEKTRTAIGVAEQDLAALTAGVAALEGRIRELRAERDRENRATEFLDLGQKAKAPVVPKAPDWK